MPNKYKSQGPYDTFDRKKQKDTFRGLTLDSAFLEQINKIKLKANERYDLVDEKNKDTLYSKQLFSLMRKKDFEPMDWIAVFTDFVQGKMPQNKQEQDMWFNKRLGGQAGLVREIDLRKELATDTWFLRYITKTYPIAILVNPEAKLTDIKQFIDVAYKFRIKDLQEKYKSKDSEIGKYRSRNTNERYNLIKDNSDKSTPEIIKILLSHGYRLNAEDIRIAKHRIKKGNK